MAVKVEVDEKSGENMAVGGSVEITGTHAIWGN